MGPLGPIPRTLGESSCLPREIQSYESRQFWNANVVEAWIKEKGTTNTLCGLKLLDYVSSRGDSAHCATCRRIASELLAEAQ